MAAKKSTGKVVDPMVVLDGLRNGTYIPVSKATEIAFPSNSQGAWGAAVKSHPYLEAAIVERTTYTPRSVERAAFDRYLAERGHSGGRPRDGLKWFYVRCDEATAQTLRDQGLTVETAAQRAKNAKAKAEESNGVETETEDEDEDEDEDVESEDVEA